ncbi:dihydropteroate synthase [Fictibacillus phosphorivorans]|uniref:dihydropteroate synthase n=1 Tax=Fictibacillus phosphorivorans TaxID=1221500 RepID=UPI00203FA24A|nr:dihydropteroate synthase [Fictibacillus phosphorivorans]MCM3719853.1 dihydropteroate synthase [Fictibacillus phosphorivorans]MCM3777543.1 dihydropteroate synthase [Fictibacillus phosphorivorans]
MILNQSKLVCGEYVLDFSKKTYVMGILNVTPDSFSDGGHHNRVEQAILHAKEMVKDGADMIDVGGESTRPGAKKVTLEEELERVIPVIEALKQEVDVPISIDTYKAETARQAVQAGAHIINDVWGAKLDSEMPHVMAESNVPVILMHNRFDTNYQEFMADVIADLEYSIALAVKAGVKPENIILDPGIGFVKSFQQNIETMRRLNEITNMGYPVLLGTSRKSMIGKALDLPVDERMEGTGATVCLGIERGCSIIRVHDVKEMSRMAKMMDIMLGKGESHG